MSNVTLPGANSAFSFYFFLCKSTYSELSLHLKKNGHFSCIGFYSKCLIRANAFNGHKQSRGGVSVTFMWQMGKGITER